MTPEEQLRASVLRTLGIAKEALGTAAMVIEVLGDPVMAERIHTVRMDVKFIEDLIVEEKT